MKNIKYIMMTRVNHGTEDEPHIIESFHTKQLHYCKENLSIAQEEAYNGEYEIIDDGEPEPGPTQLDRIEAQAVYTAMMTDTLLEE